MENKHLNSLEWYKGEADTEEYLSFFGSEPAFKNPLDAYEHQMFQVVRLDKLRGEVAANGRYYFADAAGRAHDVRRFKSFRVHHKAEPHTELYHVVYLEAGVVVFQEDKEASPVSAVHAVYRLEATEEQAQLAKPFDLEYEDYALKDFYYDVFIREHATALTSPFSLPREGGSPLVFNFKKHPPLLILRANMTKEYREHIERVEKEKKMLDVQLREDLVGAYLPDMLKPFATAIGECADELGELEKPARFKRIAELLTATLEGLSNDADT